MLELVLLWGCFVGSRRYNFSVILLQHYNLSHTNEPLCFSLFSAMSLTLFVTGGPSNGALTIATTHHSIMTGLKFDDGRVENASVEFDEEKLAPTYKLLWGVPGNKGVGVRCGCECLSVSLAWQVQVVSRFNLLTTWRFLRQTLTPRLPLSHSPLTLMPAN